MTWLFLTVLAITSRAVYGLAAKVFNNHMPPSAVAGTIVFSSVNSILVLLIAPFIGGLSFKGLSDAWLAALASAGMGALGNIFYFKGQRQIDAGTAQIAFASIVVWGTLLSVMFLNSRFSVVQLLGVVLLLVAILLAQYRKGERHLNSGVLYIMAAAAMFSGFQVSGAVLSQHMTPASYLLVSYLGSVIIPAAIYCRSLMREMLMLKTIAYRPAIRATLFACVTTIIYNLTAFFAYKYAPDRGVVVLLLTVQTVMAVVLGIIFLKERSYVGRKVSAAFLALVAAIAIKA